MHLALIHPSFRSTAHSLSPCCLDAASYHRKEREACIRTQDVVKDVEDVDRDGIPFDINQGKRINMSADLPPIHAFP